MGSTDSLNTYTNLYTLYNFFTKGLPVFERLNLVLLEQLDEAPTVILAFYLLVAYGTDLHLVSTLTLSLRLRNSFLRGTSR
jgi:hypothetical protein